MKIEDYEVKGTKVREVYLRVYVSERQPKTGKKRGMGWFKATKEQLQEMEDLLQRLEPKQVLQGLRSIKNLVRSREYAKERGKRWGRPSIVEEMAEKIKFIQKFRDEHIKNGEVFNFYENLIKDGETKEEVIELFKKHQQERIDKLLEGVSYPTKKKIQKMIL